MQMVLYAFGINLVYSQALQTKRKVKSATIESFIPEPVIGFFLQFFISFLSLVR